MGGWVDGEKKKTSNVLGSTKGDTSLYKTGNMRGAFTTKAAATTSG